MTSCSRNLVQRSSNTAKTLLFRQSSHSVPAAAPKLSGFGATLPRPSPRRTSLFSSSSRLPVELGCGVSLMPLHSTTASALLNSLLSSKAGSWGVLSEGFATPL